MGGLVSESTADYEKGRAWQRNESRRRSESERERQEAHSEMNLHFLPRLICQRESLCRLSFSEHRSVTCAWDGGLYLGN